MSNEIVFAKTAAVVAFAGQRIRLNPGEPWDAEDPFVKEHPEMFAEHVRAARSTQDSRGFREYDEIETATRAPGEKRLGRRGRRGQQQADEPAATSAEEPTADAPAEAEADASSEAAGPGE